MRVRAFGFVLLSACAAPPRPPATPEQGPPQGDIPPHTQALMDAYRQRSALETQAHAGDLRALNNCPGGEGAVQQRERYLHWIGGCLEEASAATELAAATPEQAAPLIAALDARADAVRTCARFAHVAWWESEDAVASRLEIDAQGAITSITAVPGQAAREEVACCVRRELRQARLPAPKRALSLLYVANAKPEPVDFKMPTLNKGDIKQVINQHLAEVRSCYENSMAEGARFEGRVEVQFAVAPDGSTPLARVVHSTMPTPSAGCCITDKIRTWKFPANAGVGAVFVTYPFVLELGK